MEQYKEVLANLIKSIYYQFPNKIKIKSDKDKVVFELDYNAAKRVADEHGWIYYSGTEIKYTNQYEFLTTLKQLLKVKRTLKNLYK